MNNSSGGSYGDIEIKDDHVLKTPRSTGSFPYFVREVLALQLLKKAKAPFIVKLLDIKDDTLILEKYAGDLFDTQETALPDIDSIINVLYRMLVAMTNMQGLYLCHRDIKPENILSTADGKNMSVCDFGLTRYYPNDKYPEQCTPTVQTGFYRAPELMFEDLLNPNTDTKIDIGPVDIQNLDVWSLGMTILELLDRDELIPPNIEEGDITLQELYDIFEQLYGDNGDLQSYAYDNDCHHHKLYVILCDMLTLNSTQRPSPQELLAYDIFDQIRETDHIINAESFNEQRIQTLLNIIPDNEQDPQVIEHLEAIYEYEAYDNFETPRLAVVMVYLLDKDTRTKVDSLSIINLASIIMDFNLPDIQQDDTLKLLKLYDYDLLYPVNDKRVLNKLKILHENTV